MIQIIKKHFLDHIHTIERIKEDEELLKGLTIVADAIITAYRNNKKVLLFGCGGSAADAQHIAAEFINKLELNRKCLPAIALTANTSNITAISNDSDFKNIFSRQIEGLVRDGDVVIGISTSGKSPSVLHGLETAKKYNAITVALLGSNSECCKNIANCIISVPSTSTMRTQEAHITIGHIICSLVEYGLFSDRSDAGTPLSSYQW